MTAAATYGQPYELLRRCLHEIFISLLLIAAVGRLRIWQQTAVLEGRLVNSLNGDPLAGATVVIDELKREVVSGPDGTFRFENLAPGTYHVWVRAQGYSSRRTEVTVPTRAARLSSCASISICIFRKSRR